MSLTEMAPCDQEDDAFGREGIRVRVADAIVLSKHEAFDIADAAHRAGDALRVSGCWSLAESMGEVVGLLEGRLIAAKR